MNRGLKSGTTQKQRAFIRPPLGHTTSSITHHFLWGEEACQESKPLVGPIEAPFKKSFPSLLPERVKYVPVGRRN